MSQSLITDQVILQYRDGDWQLPGQVLVAAEPIMGTPVQANHVQANHVQANLVQSNLVQSNHVQSNHVQSNHVQSNLVQSNHVQSNHVQGNPVGINIGMANCFPGGMVHGQPYFPVGESQAGFSGCLDQADFLTDQGQGFSGGFGDQNSNQSLAVGSVDRDRILKGIYVS